ncbi:hypothetical protein B0H14DRAFT_2609249 [Mycena olivaceomarginata]|nr:hypothetical protein B0H14DRAFT_2609249 [Mycena olivaceomarginata]
MCLVRSTVEYDPSQRHDWCLSRKMDRTYEHVSGRLIQPLNPTLSVRAPEKPTSLFESSELMAFGATLLEQILPEDFRRSIPNAMRSGNFPYRFQGKGCFLCEHDTNGRPIDLQPENTCPKCDPPIALDISRASVFLSTVVLTCFTIHQSTEAMSSAACACVRDQCAGSILNGERCGPKQPAVWKYNLEFHFQNFHQLRDPRTWAMDITITDHEIKALKAIWDTRQNYPRPRNLQKTKKRLEISEMHSSRLAFRDLRSDGVNGTNSVRDLLDEPTRRSETHDEIRRVESDDESDSPAPPSLAPVDSIEPPPSSVAWDNVTMVAKSDRDSDDIDHRETTPEVSQDTGDEDVPAVLQGTPAPIEPHPQKRSRRAARLLNLGGCDVCGEDITDAEKTDK